MPSCSISLLARALSDTNTMGWPEDSGRRQTGQKVESYFMVFPRYCLYICVYIYDDGTNYKCKHRQHMMEVSSSAGSRVLNPKVLLPHARVTLSFFFLSCWRPIRQGRKGGNEMKKTERHLYFFESVNILVEKKQGMNSVK